MIKQGAALEQARREPLSTLARYSFFSAGKSPLSMAEVILPSANEDRVRDVFVNVYYVDLYTRITDVTTLSLRNALKSWVD